MSLASASIPLLHDKTTAGGDLLGEVLDGLRRQPKSLPCKLFYDAYGSRLFDQICDLPEYYLTRTELAIMERHIEEMTAYLEPGTLLVEYGSGSSLKTRLLLDRAPGLAGYVPIDISRDHLMESAAGLRAAYPHLRIHPICADYTAESLPDLNQGDVSRVVVYFPGSTIGNFTPEEAQEFLSRIAGVCGPGGGLLIGVDLRKNVPALEAAYNDAQGVTAAFNLNALRRINRELGGTFQLDRFRHRAFYNVDAGRIEMHLESLADQFVRVGEVIIPFRQGETIRTEYSYKYTMPEFEALAVEAGFAVEQVWTDEQRYFSVQYLVAR